MKGFSLLLTVFLLINNVSFSQSMLGRLYLKANTCLNNNFSSNSNVNIIDDQFFIDNSNEVVSSGLGHCFSINIGLDINPNLFAEVGYGQYTITQSHRIPQGGLLYTYGYKNVDISTRYHQIPFYVGYYFLNTNKVRVANYIGGNFLVDLVNSDFSDNNGTQKLKKKKNNPYNGSYVLLPNNLNWSTMLFNIGFDAEYIISSKFSIKGSLGVVLGFRNVTNSGIFVFQDRESYVASANSFSSTKGDAISLGLSLKYKPWGKK